MASRRDGYGSASGLESGSQKAIASLNGEAMRKQTISGFGAEPWIDYCLIFRSFSIALI